MLDVRRSYAHARLQLDEALAERLLRNLHLDEISVFGHGDPRTFPTLALYWWAVGRAGRFEEAEAGLHTLESNMVRLSNPDPALLRHVQCKRSWNLGQLGRKNEMLRGYEAVTSGRSRELGVSHGDTLDARHSVGKMLVWCGDQAQAVEILRSVLAERRRLQGRHHPDTLETKKYFFLARAVAHPTSIAITRWRLRRALHRILNEQIHVRGSDHPDTLDTRRCLAAIADPTERS